MTGQTTNGERTGESNAQWRPAAGDTEESSEQRLRNAIVSAVADAEGVEPGELSSRPLYDSVDLGALDEAFFGLGPGDVPGDVERVVEFRYGDYRVTVSTDGEVAVRGSTGSEPRSG